MPRDDAKRLSRLAALLVQLQTKRVVTATELAAKFSVSVRTVYRDVRALEQAGVPVLTEEGKGYRLMEGYRLPPVMFTEEEANALTTAEGLIATNKDASLAHHFTSAAAKIRSVLRYNERDKAALLHNRTKVYDNRQTEHTTNYLSQLQVALTNYKVCSIRYRAVHTHQSTQRTVEPFALLHTQGAWLLVAWCRLRNVYRVFRLDCIVTLTVEADVFPPHRITLEQYFERFAE